MQKNCFALLLHNQESLFAPLRTMLEGQSIETRQARSCAEALTFLAQDDSPQIIFAGTRLPDGTWTDALNLAAKASKPARVVVVSRLADLTLYLDVIERGAFDFIAPPFRPFDIAHIVKSAARAAQAAAAQPAGSRPPAAAPRRDPSRPRNSRSSAA